MAVWHLILWECGFLHTAASYLYMYMRGSVKCLTHKDPPAPLWHSWGSSTRHRRRSLVGKLRLLNLHRSPGRARRRWQAPASSTLLQVEEKIFSLAQTQWNIYNDSTNFSNFLVIVNNKKQKAVYFMVLSVHFLNLHDLPKLSGPVPNHLSLVW